MFRAPHVILWAGETILPEPLLSARHGVYYADPRVDLRHRDDDGVLWEAWGGHQVGPRIYTLLHPIRQREAMRGLRCATCNGDGDRSTAGMLWLLPLLDGPAAEDTTWEGVPTTVPPTCESCADRVVWGCPWMRDGHVRLRARVAEQIGVRGSLYPRPGTTAPAERDALVRYDSPDAQYVVARYAVRELSQVTLEAVVAATPFTSGTACAYAGVTLTDGGHA
ncbi:hypothetical protein [Streptomyces sp. NPDC057509]|uniref:hypothetical protein n=1 Tax=Streptomyces sp. NPDC057509 TaxID=3346152 RepID=UPI00367F5F2D